MTDQVKRRTVKPPPTPYGTKSREDSVKPKADDKQPKTKGESK